MSNKMLWSLPLPVLLCLAGSMLDYSIFFTNGTQSAQAVTYKSAGMLEKFFPKTSPVKYQNVVENNIFYPSEKTAAEPTNTAIKSPGLMLDLRGITITPEQKFAVIVDVSQNKSIVVNEGEIVNNWTVGTIQNDRVMLESGGNVHELLIKADQK
ncbi:MAG: hypothetical protein OEZ39_13730 [Gammaproteobacteria bacterium]|nr:hypothetical protein [Gammaproteobacteria bacterium]MDH5652911.1 hypothetical protein [Gammaproteobacteria bacterium]